MPRRTLALYILLGVVLYVATAIPLGILLYSIKNSLGWEVFSHTGGHALTYCLRKEYDRQLKGLAYPDTTPTYDKSPAHE